MFYLKVSISHNYSVSSATGGVIKLLIFKLLFVNRISVDLIYILQQKINWERQ